MADDLAHWKKRLDDEFGQVTRRFDDIHAGVETGWRDACHDRVRK